MQFTKPAESGPAIDLAKKRETVDTETPEGNPKSIKEVIQELNKRLHEEGCYLTHTFGWNELRNDRTDDYFYGDDPWPGSYVAPGTIRASRIACYPMRGSSEAFWIDLLAIRANPANPGSPVRHAIVIACCKVFSWAEAFETATLTQQLLDVTD